MPTPVRSDALAQAAGAGELTAVEALLRDDPSAARGWQPIMNAAFGGHAAVVRLLLASGADPNVQSATAHRHRPLHRAIEHKATFPKTPGHIETVESLLDAGADPRARGTWHRLTALQVAALGDERRFIPPLLAANAELDLYDAAVLGQVDRALGLLEADRALATAPDANGWPALQYCAASRQHEGDPVAAAGLLRIAERLLELGADPTPALGWATVGANHPALVELLLRRGADPNDGESIYHAAEAPERFAACLELLLAHGVDVNHDGADGHHQGTPLGWVSFTRRTPGARWLLAHGADPNRRFGERRETALHAAARAGASPELVGLLLAHGAERDARDAEGQTPLDVARRGGKSKLVELLASR